MGRSPFIACHCCDLIHEIIEVPVGGTARCSRCGTSLYRPRRDSLNRSSALVVAGIILYLIANTHPFLGFQIGSQVRETTLATGIFQLYQQDMNTMAMLVLVTVVIVPASHLLCLLYILIPLKAKRVPPYLSQAFRLYFLLKPWGMMEIFMLGILVAAFKLLKMATLIPGIALFAFMALIFVLAAISLTFDEHLVWEKIDYQ